MRKSSRSNNGEASCPPGPLPGGTPGSHYVFPACCRGEHVHYLLSVCPTFRLIYSLEFGSFSTDFNLLQAAQFMFPFVFGKLIYRPTFDCSCERYLTMIPSMLYAEDFRLSYCVNWLFTSSELLRELTVHKLWATAWIDCSVFPSSSTSTSHRGFPRVLPNIYGSSHRSLGRLLDADNQSTFTTCRNRRHRRVSTNEVHGLYALLLWIFYAGCLFVHLTLDSDWSIYDFELKLIMTLVSFTGAPEFLTLTKSLIGICLSMFIYCYKNYLWLHCNSITWLITV